MAVISFFEEDISFKIKHKTALKGWIKETILAEGAKLRELSFIFCSDNYLLKIKSVNYLVICIFSDFAIASFVF